MLSLKTALTNIANWIKGVDDYVVESGTQSGWYYRKWKSNKIEMWHSGSTTGSSQSWNGGYGVNCNISFPFSVKNGMAFLTAKTGSGYGMMASSPSWSTAQHTISFDTWGSQIGITYYNVYVIGTWGGQ